MRQNLLKTLSLILSLSKDEAKIPCFFSHLPGRAMTDFFRLSPRAADYKARLERFMAEHIYPNEAALFETAETQADRWEALKLMEELKAKAKAEGLAKLELRKYRNPGDGGRS
jgi:hypothetical protein